MKSMDGSDKGIHADHQRITFQNSDLLFDRGTQVLQYKELKISGHLHCNKGGERHCFAVMVTILHFII